MGEIRWVEVATQGCGRHGHPELVIRYPEGFPLSDVAESLLRYLEQEVAVGTRFKDGQTLQYGWLTLRFAHRPGGALSLLEPNMREPAEPIESVFHAIHDAWQQKEVADSVGLLSRLSVPRMEQLAVTCKSALLDDRFFLVRNPPSSPKDSGWYVGCADERHEHRSPESLEVLTLYSVACRIPALCALFALPVGCDVAVSSLSPPRYEVWFEGRALRPRPDSYLAQLDQTESHPKRRAAPPNPSRPGRAPRPRRKAPKRPRG